VFCFGVGPCRDGPVVVLWLIEVVVMASSLICPGRSLYEGNKYTFQSCIILFAHSLHIGMPGCHGKDSSILSG
jgi:hypothetical protein